MGVSCRIANRASLIVAALLVFISESRAQNCVITGGTNYGSITQNCTALPPPLTVLSNEFEAIAMPDGTFRHQIFVQVGQPVTLLLIACGDGVVDLGAGPYPAGMSSVSGKMTHENCVAHRFFNTSPGRWAMWATTNAKDTKFTLQPIIEP
jgi:hypothetical protein